MLVVALAAGIVAPIVMAAPGNTAVQGFREVGRVPFKPNLFNATAEPLNENTATLLLDVRNRRGYKFIAEGRDPDDTSEAMPARIEVFDLDTFEAIGQPQELPDLRLHVNANQTHRFEPLVTHGPDALYVKEPSSNQVVVISKQNLQITERFAGALPQNFTQNSGDLDRALDQQRAAHTLTGIVAGLAHRPADGGLDEGKLLVLTEIRAQAAEAQTPNITALSQWDPETGEQEWSLRTPACSSGRGTAWSHHGTALTLSRAPSGTVEAVFGCIGRSNISEVWRVPLPADGSIPDQGILAGRIPQGRAFYPDQAGRSVLVLSSSGTGQAFVGVDLDRQGVYGQVGVSVELFWDQLDRVAVGGIDPRTGRLYTLAPPSENGGRTATGGVQLVDSRRRPLPVGDTPFTHDELGVPEGVPGKQQIRVDPATAERPNRVYVRFGSEPFLRVFEDTIPVRDDIPLGDADRFTADVEEVDGETAAAFNASTSAFGTRVIIVGGLYGALPSLFTSGVGATFPRDSLKEGIPGNAAVDLGIQCEAPDRQLTFAALPAGGTSLSDTGVNAAATPFEADPGTVQDLSNPAGACWPTRSVLDNFNLSFLDALLDTVAEQTEDARDQATKAADDAREFANDTVGDEVVPDVVPGLDPLDDEEGDGGVSATEPPATGAQGDDFDGDGRSENDLDEAWGHVVPNPYPFASAVCSSPGRSSRTPAGETDPAGRVGGTGDEPEQSDVVVRYEDRHFNLGPLPGFDAAVACAADGREVTAGSGSLRDLGLGPVTVGSTETETTLRWKDDGGAVVTTTARASGIRIAGVVTIGEVRSRAVSDAAGRTGTAGARYTREWCGITAGGESMTGCFDADGPEVQQFVAQLNERVLRPRNFEIRTPPVDPDLIEGTPKGALAAAQKDRFTSVGERLLNNDNSTAVAAMELIHVNDTGLGRARQLYQFAATEASTSYNVILTPQFDFDFDFDAGGAPAKVLALPEVVVPGEPAVPAQPGRAVAQSASQSTPSPAPGLGGGSGGGPLNVLSSGLKWLLRNPFEALKIAMLVFTAFGLPAYLNDRRGAIAATVARKES